jgi:Fe2+ or Zn2+ uptake regulation protein
MVMGVRSPSELVNRFRAEGLKVTPQRELVFRLLHDNHSHPTAEAVYQAATETMPMISLKTVYQVLHDLRELGELQAIECGTGAVRFDPNLDEHHHLVCVACSAVFDVDVDIAGISLNRAQRQGFQIDAVEVTYRGHCATCRASS